MRTWEITNSNGQTIRIRAEDISDLTCGFGFEEEETYDVVKAVMVEEGDTE